MESLEQDSEDSSRSSHQWTPMRRPSRQQQQQQSYAGIWRKMQEFDTNISNNTIKPSMITEICNLLKENGSLMDDGQQARSQMDICFKEYRNLVRSSQIDLASKCRLLHLIELRAGKWYMAPEINDFYESRLRHLTASSSSSETSDVSDGNDDEDNDEVTIGQRKASSEKSRSGSKSKPILKEDLVIRNSDSGKVMGIRGRRVRMIEEFSKTVISFQRVAPTQKERLLQISGPCKENIERAKQLITETILRNSSPCEEPESNETTVIMPCRAVKVDEKKRNCQPVGEGTNNAGGLRLQRSSSLGHALVSQYQAENLIHEYVYTGNSSNVLKVSANTGSVLSEAVQALKSHFDVKRSMRRYLPDFEFDESFSSENSDLEDDIQSPDSKRAGETDCDSVDFIQIPAVHRTIESIVATSDVSSDDGEEKEASEDDVKPVVKNGTNIKGSTVAPVDSIISYSRSQLIQCSGSALSQSRPDNFELMRENLSDILKE